MSHSLEEVGKKFQVLVEEWKHPNHNITSCHGKVKELTGLLTRFEFLPRDQYKASRRELLIARETLEIGCFLALEERGIQLFERYISQLKCYYYDYQGTLPESPMKYELLGLNLLSLLVQGRLADFHVELERLPIETITSNVYISHPVSMEQYLMEGNFRKVFLSKGNTPSRSYDFFVNELLMTTRDEVASCIETTYKVLSLKDASRMLFFSDEQSMKTYGTQRQWCLDSKNMYVFAKAVENTDETSSTKVAEIMLEYTKELDQII